MTKAVEKKTYFSTLLVSTSRIFTSTYDVWWFYSNIIFFLFCYCFRKRKYQNEDICLCRDLFKDKSRDEGKLLIQLLMHPHIFCCRIVLHFAIWFRMHKAQLRWGGGKSVFDYINLSTESSSLKLFMKILFTMPCTNCNVVVIELKSSNLVNIFPDSMIYSR